MSDDRCDLWLSSNISAYGDRRTIVNAKLLAFILDWQQETILMQTGNLLYWTMVNKTRVLKLNWLYLKENMAFIHNNNIN